MCLNQVPFLQHDILQLQNVGLYFKGRKNKGGNSEVPNADQTRSRYHEGQILDVNLTPPGGIRPKRTYSYYHEDKSVPVLPQVVSSPGKLLLYIASDFRQYMIWLY